MEYMVEPISCFILMNLEFGISSHRYFQTDYFRSQMGVTRGEKSDS